MKYYKKGISQTIVLDQEGLTNNDSVKLSIIGENGQTLKDNTGTELKDLALTFNSTTNKFQIELIINSDTPEQYIRLFFYGLSSTVITSNYYPEDAKLESVAGTIISQAEIVPVQFFIDFILAESTKLDADYKASINAYIQDKNGLREFLKSGQDDLEKDCEIYFTEREITEKRDNNFEPFPSNLWNFQVSYPPINELTNFKIVYGEFEVADISPKLFTWDRMQGIIEFLPLPAGETAGLYSMLLQNISGVAVSIIKGGGLLNRIPNMFQVTYKTGLFPYSDEIEKAGLRKAISRRAYMDMIHIIDPRGREASASESTDGVSASKTFRIDKIIDTLDKQEKEFIKKLQKKYAKNVNMVIV